MARRPPIQTPHAVRARLDQRHRRLTTARAVREAIVSLAGLIGRPVRHQDGLEVGKLVDVVARFSGEQTYPPVSGLIVRVGRRRAYIDAGLVADLGHSEITLRSARMDLRDYSRRDGEVLLARDVLDHQLVDVDGRQVIRAADLYIARLQGQLRLVGVDVSAGSLLRRLGPAKTRTRPTPERVIDWAAIQPFGGPSSAVRLRSSHEGLHRLRPGELADLLEDLGREAQQELLESLDPAEAADALEEMDPEELESLLRGAQPETAATLVAAMETDEAAEALRALGDDERQELLNHMPAARAAELMAQLSYEEDSAGGIMTTTLALASGDEEVGELRERLAAMSDHRGEIDAVTVVDDEGLLVGDVPLFDLLVAPSSARLAELAESDAVLTVDPATELSAVAAQLVESRRNSVLVVENGRPIGRILADDIVDALLPERGRLHFRRLLQ